MPRYRAKITCFVDGARIRAGQEFTTSAPLNKDAWEEVATPAAPAAAPSTRPAKASSLPVDDPFDKMDEETARSFIQSKSGKAPGPKASLEAIRAAARAAAGTDGAT